MTEPRQREDVQNPVPRRNWTIFALIGGLVLLVLLVAYFVSSRNPEQDKLTSEEVARTTPADREKLCARSATYDFIKRDLFRRAAQLRGADQAAYDRLAGYAVLRMDNPVMESQDSATKAVHCSGSLSLDLPPGVAVVGGRRTLSSDVDYTVTTAADGSGTVVLLRNVDAIVTPLATLGGVNEPAPAGLKQEPAGNEAAPEVAAPTNVVQSTPSVPNPQPLPPSQDRSVSERPSFDCAKARTRGEVAVCGDASLAALDRQMAAQYDRALMSASPDERDLLRDTAHRFYAYRDRCRDDRCVGDAYAGRIREIRDIMDGRWQPPR